MNRALAIAIVLLIPFFLGKAPVACGQSVAEQPTVDAMKEIGQSPWFDPEKQAIVPVPLRDTSSDTQHRDSRWLPKAERVKKQSSNSSGAIGSGSQSGSFYGWLVVGLGFVMIAGAILYAFSKLDPDGIAVLPGTQRNQGVVVDLQTLQRIRELPLELRRTDVDLRTEAERLMNLGQFDEAIKCLFGHQLLILDRHGYVRLSRGKTNGRYVAETRKDSPPAASLLRATVMAFEASYFGRHTPTVDLFRQLWQGNEQLEGLTVKRQEVLA